MTIPPKEPNIEPINFAGALSHILVGLHTERIIYKHTKEERKALVEAIKPFIERLYE